ncbi:transforming growth factor beta regulator 1 [Onthophagus taurus]|uniref:transforming growth factor beta regulator 1 n=1 Tax=Onthophagus taurus TaxID=166361 RepID=UPI0039BDE06D
MNDQFMTNLRTLRTERPPGKWKVKLDQLKNFIREYVHENAALCDEIADVQEQIIMRTEERKFLLRKLCAFEPETEKAVEALSKRSAQNNNNNNNSNNNNTSSSTSTANIKRNKRKNLPSQNSKKMLKSKKPPLKMKKRFFQQILLDSMGRPIFPIELGNLTVHSLGEVVSDKSEFHSEDVIYPVGYVSTRIYGSLKDPTIKCIYTCTISEANGLPRFQIASDDSENPIVGGSADVCHSLLLQKINDCLSFNVVSTRPRGNDFFGLSHPTVLNLIQTSPGTRKCSNYKWSKFEVSKTDDKVVDDADACLNFNLLQRSIDFCKYKMAPDILPRPPDDLLETKNYF